MTSYTVSVPNAVTSVTITPTVAAPGSIVRVSGAWVTSGSASAAININTGINTIPVSVFAENAEAFKPYEITITRAAN